MKGQPREPMRPVMVTATEAAAMLGIERARVAILVQAGHLRGMRKSSSLRSPLLVSVSSIERFAEDPPAILPGGSDEISCTKG